MAKQQQGSKSDDNRPIHSCDEELLRRWERERLERLEGIQMEQLVPAHSDGTPRLARDLSKEDNDALRAACQLYQIAEYFKFPESEDDERIEYIDAADFVAWLDEIQGYAETIDITYELHYIGRLVHLLHHVLYYPHAGIRAKTAELVTTMVKNNPRSQQLVMEANGLQPLLYNFISDPDATSRTKALGAISSLIQNNKPVITAFRLSNGYAALMQAMESDSVMLQREVLNLIMYLLHENSSDNNILIELGFPCSMICLIGSDDAEVREATLRGLLVLTKDEGGNNGQLVKNDDAVKQVLRNQIESIIVTPPELLDVTREEIQLMDSLWNACYNEPSLLRQKGLLVLPGEDAPAPDVPSKLFEPPLRGAWAAAEAADRNSVSEEPDVASKLFEPPLRGAWVAAEVADRNSVSEEPDVASKLFEPPLRGAWAAAEAAGRNSVSKKKVAPLLLNTWVKNDDKLNQVLRELNLVLHERKQIPQEQIETIISATDAEVLSATRVERQLIDSLWNACYNEGVLELCGMDAHVSYVASKPFEPPLRGVWAAAEAAGRIFASNKKVFPLLINTWVHNNDDKLHQVLWELKLVLHERKPIPQERIERIISAMNPEDLSAARGERQLMDSLWNACYNEDVLELCGMDAHAPYVASKPFEPPLRGAWAAAEAADRNSVSEKKEAPLLINVGVKNRTEPTFFTSTQPNQPRSRFPIFKTALNRSVWCRSSILFGVAKCIRFGRFGL